MIILFSILLGGCSAGNLSDQNQVQPTSPSKIEDSTNQKDKKGTMNFLLIGSDSRGEPHSFSDAIIIAQYAPKEGNIKLISLMRDSYVKIPGHRKGYDKLNMAYFIGGNELLKKTIYQNFGIKVDHSVSIDFEGFANFIDLIAPEGITVNVSQKMIDDFQMNVKPGENALKGRELLKYVRFRHDDESDFGRVKRQQEVIVKVKEQLKNKFSHFESLAALPDFVEESLNHVESDMDKGEILSVLSKLVFYPIKNIDRLRIPIQNSYVNKTYPHAGVVLEINMEANREALKDFLLKPSPVNREYHY
ncbi:LCP family protein [Bacillus sp. ISL-40]|uniref:LCP family protein n=1 Tax=unclassified Bacillus (in: firmicutes) TaxID=185979 RepID=UPI001BE4F56B|nr:MULTISPECIES: LCP family protein [unclassified Bacillus (in: firmicutes)]MBT2696458.1 LCP family protein [Bacillus sp. ISL-40]MBT2723178.1 LCP family protein [Bacillus sp. ISL-46]MBT2741526.1 LCP family protein [Bacillus sp. ISL-77]